MNHVRSVLILSIAAISIWLLLKREQPERPKVDTGALQTPSDSTTENRAQKFKKPSNLGTPGPAAPKMVKPPPPSPPVTAEQEDPHKPPKGSVPFEVIGGWVVAYGDVLMGKPTSPDYPNSGFVEAPKPRYWTEKIIPFSIHVDLPNPERVLRAVEQFNSQSPSIKFVPYSGQADNVVFAPMDRLCMSYLGKIGGNQPIYLDHRCAEHEILHEMLHALGFIHEHTRSDRDAFVRVNWNNIEEDKQSQFMVAPPSMHERLRDRPFDYQSVMLYSPDIFALDRTKPTLESFSSDKPVAPVQNGMSAEDIARLQILYGK